MNRFPSSLMLHQFISGIDAEKRLAKVSPSQNEVSFRLLYSWLTLVTRVFPFLLHSPATIVSLPLSNTASRSPFCRSQIQATCLDPTLASRCPAMSIFHPSGLIIQSLVI